MIYHLLINTILLHKSKMSILVKRIDRNKNPWSFSLEKIAHKNAFVCHLMFGFQYLWECSTNEREGSKM